MKGRGKGSIKRRMLVVLLATLGLVFVVVSLMFLQTARSMQATAEESMGFRVKEASKSIDELRGIVANVSDVFSTEATVRDMLEGKYADEPEKLLAMREVRIRVFEGPNRVQDINYISAIYDVRDRELFNFVDAACQGEETIQGLLALDALNPDNLARFYWQPLGENILTARTSGNPRTDAVVLGTRRIYSEMVNAYPYLHVFALTEKQIYDCYSQLAEGLEGEIYILDSAGRLISSSSVEAVAAREVPEGLAALVLERERDSVKAQLEGTEYLISVYESELRTGQAPDGEWITVLVMPMTAVTRELRQLFITIILVLALCVLVCGVAMVYLYRHFMQPISALNDAMYRVDNGDMQAYIPEEGEGRGETGRMIGRYNRMLQSINRNVQEKLELEETKKQLDMQVLTSQMNPHFLYNTLETIVWKAGEAARPDIAKIASSLGRLYRLSIKGKGNFVPLQQELEHLESYIAIQRSRYEGQFQYECRVRGVDTDIKLPRLVLQPMVENVFLYAVEGANVPVTIRLTIYRRGDTLVVKVVDNGCGMDAGQLATVRRRIRGEAEDTQAEPPRRGTGIGLYNINARLGLYMGVQNGLCIASKPGRGTRVMFTVPVDTAEI